MTVWRTANPSSKLTDPDDAMSPRETTCADAQEAVNFVVFEPGWLPDDCSVTEITRRPEQPPGRPDDVSSEDIGQTPHSEGNPCSLRLVVEGEDRWFRLKQFCYDWAPPAAAIAPLWRTPNPVSFACGDAVGWLGTDYKDRRGACVQRNRTQIELSVAEGEFDDEELMTIMDGLTPAAPDLSPSVQAIPFHRLNYWVRYRCRPPAVPHGLWTHNPARPYDESWALSPAALGGDLLVSPLLPPGERFVLDSAVAFPDAVECVFRHRANTSDHLWLMAAAKDSPLAPTIPPEPADQPAETRRVIDLRGTTVHYAALTEEWGAWEAIWAEDDAHYAVWAGASDLLDGDTFLALVESLEVP